MKKHNTIVTIVVIVATVCLLLAMIIKLYPIILEVIHNVSDESKTAAYVREYGAWGVPILIGLAALQYIVVILPTPAVGALVGLCYGVFWGTIIYLAGCALGNLFVFTSIRRLDGIIAPLLHKKAEQKTKKNKLLSIEQLDKVKKPWVIVFLFFLIAVIPTIPITFLFARTKMPTYQFILAAVTGILPAAIVYAVLGNHISEGSYTSAIVMAGIIIVVITVLFIFKNKIINKVVKE